MTMLIPALALMIAAPQGPVADTKEAAQKT